jgi:hypothetical protein
MRRHLQCVFYAFFCAQGLIPIVGAAREPGTSMLIEDVACPVDKLDGMMIDLIDMFQVWHCLTADVWLSYTPLLSNASVESCTGTCSSMYSCLLWYWS